MLGAAPPFDRLLGDLAAVRDHGEGIRDDEDADDQARAIQMSVPTGCCVSRSRIALTMVVTGWFSAKARTAPGMVSVGTKAELMNGRKMSG